MRTVEAELAQRNLKYRNRLMPNGQLKPNPTPNKGFVRYTEHDHTGEEAASVANLKHQNVWLNPKEN